MLRRHFNLAVCSAALAPHILLASNKRGPMFWVATRGKARVFIMALGDARADDESWFTPAIRQAFNDSSELWIEVAPPEVSAGRDPETKAKADAEYQNLRHELPGSTFFH